MNLCLGAVSLLLDKLVVLKENRCGVFKIFDFVSAMLEPCDLLAEFVVLLCAFETFSPSVMVFCGVNGAGGAQVLDVGHEGGRFGCKSSIIDVKLCKAVILRDK